MKRFYKDNKQISCILIVAILVIASYLISLDWTEWFRHGGDIFNLIYNLAIGYLVSFVFYIMQVYIPSIKRIENTNRIIHRRLLYLVDDMRILINEVVSTTYDRKPKEPYTEEQLRPLLKIKSTDRLKSINIQKYDIVKNTFECFTLKEWLPLRINSVENDINRLLSFYEEYIPPDLLTDIEDVLKTEMHNLVRQLIVGVGIFTPNEDRNNFYWEYYQLLLKIENDTKHIYGE